MVAGLLVSSAMTRMRAKLPTTAVVGTTMEPLKVPPGPAADWAASSLASKVPSLLKSIYTEIIRVLLVALQLLFRIETGTVWPTGRLAGVRAEKSVYVRQVPAGGVLVRLFSVILSMLAPL